LIRKQRLEASTINTILITTPRLLGMAKRRADKQLTRDDLDRLDDDAPEDDQYRENNEETEGNRLASPAVLAQRKLIKARRSIPTDNNNDLNNKPLYANIQLQAPSHASLSPFSSGLTSGFTSGFGSSFTPGSSTGLSFGVSTATGFSSTIGSQGIRPLETRPPPEMPLTNGISKEEGSSRDPEYNSKLRGLNDSFVSHLSQFVANHPEADFTKNCKEYISYLDKLDKEFPVKHSQTTSVSRNFTSTTLTTNHINSPNNNLSFGPSIFQIQKEATSSDTKTNTNGTASLTSLGSTSGGFTFGLTSSTGTTGFSFGSSPSVPTMVSSPSTALQPENNGDEEEEHVPPKVDDAKSGEEGAEYSKK